MTFGDVAGDLAARLKKKQQQEGKPDADKPVDFDELYVLRARMLGVLIRDARLAKGRTLEECAAWVAVDPQTLHLWEIGDATPSLPQLEVLAYQLAVPISHFWTDTTLTGNSGRTALAEREYLDLRQRIVGALLAKMRSEAGLSPDELAAQIGIPVEKISAYELGEEPIPMIELTSLAAALNISMTCFLETKNRVGQLLALQEAFRNFNEMPDEMRAFVSNPVNASFVELAMWLSNLEAADLKGIAESILNLSRLNSSELGQIAGKMLDITL